MQVKFSFPSWGELRKDLDALEKACSNLDLLLIYFI